MIEKSNSLIGKRVKLINNHSMDAKVGSVAIITGFKGGWVLVKWAPKIRQRDGAYSLNKFELYSGQQLLLWDDVDEPA